MEPGADWSFLTFQRRMETFGKKGENLVAIGPSGEKDNVWSVYLLMADMISIPTNEGLTNPGAVGRWPWQFQK